MKDCPRDYTSEEIIKSADLWDPFNTADIKNLADRERASRQVCAASTSVTDTGGWCLHTHPREHVSLPNNQSYFMPKVIHVAADGLVLEQLHLLLKRPDGKYDSLNDFGAGVGQFGHALLALDPKHRYHAYDGAGDVQRYTNNFVSFFDFSIPLSLPRADWLMCLEVGEHIPHEMEKHMIRNLHAHNKKGLIISWGILGQYGHHHINNHSKEYLVKLFNELGYDLDEGLTASFSVAAKGKEYNPYHPWFRKSLLVLRRRVPLKE